MPSGKDTPPGDNKDGEAPPTDGGPVSRPASEVTGLPARDPAAPRRRKSRRPSPSSMPRRTGPVSYTTETALDDERAAVHVQSTVTPAQQVPAAKHGTTSGAPRAKPGSFEKLRAQDAGRHRPTAEPAGAEESAAPAEARRTKPSDLVSRTAGITTKRLQADGQGTPIKRPADSPQGGRSTPESKARPEGKGGRNRRKAAAHPANDEGTGKLRTVRETSAGGLVISGGLSSPVDELCAVLIGRVDRRGRMMWSLPKGHIETGETAEQTAIREVAEETGIAGTVMAPLGKIDYWFVSEGRRIHKTVHHYLLRSIGGELSDADYEVSEVAWVPLRELPRRLTYSDERRLARMARGVIADLAADPFRLAKSEAESVRTEPNAYEKAAAARNQRRNDPTPSTRSRRRRRRARRPAAGDA
ncbi:MULTISPECIES: NUDIX hydrolase [Gordonia]|nr:MULTISPECIES: NUDIX hydrolase [Gordonia]